MKNRTAKQARHCTEIHTLIPESLLGLMLLHSETKTKTKTANEKNQKRIGISAESFTNTLILKGLGHAKPVIKNFKASFSIRTPGGICGNSTGGKISPLNPCRYWHRPGLYSGHSVQVCFFSYGHRRANTNSNEQKNRHTMCRIFSGEFTPQRKPKRSLQNQS